MHNSTNEYAVSILVNGRQIPEIQWNSRTYIEGRKNSEYSLYVRNNTSRPVLCIPSVDGLNVLEGTACGLSSPGYVIAPYSYIEIPGWKVKGVPQAGRFKFNPQGAKYGEDETYVESQGLDPTNQGSIGFMIFRQKEYVTFTNDVQWKNPWQPVHPLCSSNNERGFSAKSSAVGSHSEAVATAVNYSSTMDASIGAQADCGDAHLGTGWGEAVEFNTHDVEFERADPANPDAVFVYYYDTIRNLRRLGVPVEQFYGHESSPEANPFPASPHVHGGGCTPPAGWRRKKGRRRY